MRLTPGALVARARAAEAAGFVGIAGMDHLAPPLAEDQPMYEALTTATWLAARTERLVQGQLVLCDALRHPAVLARQAVSIDHFSGGRFELGIGAGSVQAELDQYGFFSTEPRFRVRRLAESLALLKALWSGEAVDFDGEFFSVKAARQLPTPLTRIPIVIGAMGPKMLQLVAEHADWWNVMLTHLHLLDELRPHVGKARVSAQVMVALVPSEDQREEIAALTARRWPGMNGVAVGSAAELVDTFGSMEEQGVERVYTWFSDFAREETLAAFGTDVIGALGG